MGNDRHRSRFRNRDRIRDNEICVHPSPLARRMGIPDLDSSREGTQPVPSRTPQTLVRHERATRVGRRARTALAAPDPFLRHDQQRRLSSR